MTDSLFQSAQLSLRPFEPDDVPALAAYLNHPDLTGRRYIPWTFPELAPLSQQQVQGIVQKWSQVEKGLQLAVVRRQGQELIGHGGCDWSWDPHCPSLSVVVAPAHQRQRYASRVLSLLLRYLFEYTPAHVVTCWVADWNLEGFQFAVHHGSCWVADWNLEGFQFAVHHGFRQAGRMRRAGIRQGKYYDLIVQDLLRSEWQQSGGGSHAP